MTESAKRNLRMALTHNATAKQYLEACKHETEGGTRYFINALLNKVKSIETTSFSMLTENREEAERFREQIFRTDYLQFEHIMVQLLQLPEEQVNAVEVMVDMLAKGESLQIEKVA